MPFYFLKTPPILPDNWRREPLKNPLPPDPGLHRARGKDEDPLTYFWSLMSWYRDPAKLGDLGPLSRFNLEADITQAFEDCQQRMETVFMMRNRCELCGKCPDTPGHKLHQQIRELKYRIEAPVSFSMLINATKYVLNEQTIGWNTLENWYRQSYFISGCAKEWRGISVENRKVRLSQFKKKYHGIPPPSTFRDNVARPTLKDRSILVLSHQSKEEDSLTLTLESPSLRPKCMHARHTRAATIATTTPSMIRDYSVPSTRIMNQELNTAYPNSSSSTQITQYVPTSNIPGPTFNVSTAQNRSATMNTQNAGDRTVFDRPLTGFTAPSTQHSNPFIDPAPGPSVEPNTYCSGPRNALGLVQNDAPNGGYIASFRAVSKCHFPNTAHNHYYCGNVLMQTY